MTFTYSDEEIARRIELGEDNRWEFKQVEFGSSDKPRKPDREGWSKEITAFANGKGGAILCGLTDDRQLQDLSPKQLDTLESFLREISQDHVKPAVNIIIEKRQTPEGQRYLLVEVPQGHALHKSKKGVAFKRIGSASKEMDGNEALRLAQNRSQANFLWFDKQPVNETGFRTLDEKLWKPMLNAASQDTPERALRKMGLLVDDDQRTTRASVAGVLLCCANPTQWLPNACIKATCYAGQDQASGQIDAQIIDAPIDQQIEQAMAFARRNTRVAARKSPAREDLPQYSTEALFETLVNAVVHRDYSIRGSTIRLLIFSDRIEIYSPGGLPNNLTVDSMADRQSTRNELLASSLGRMPVRNPDDSARKLFLERRGDGVPIIKRKTYELSGRHPVFDLLDDAELRVTLPAAHLQKNNPGNATLTVHCDGQPMAEAHLLCLFPNKTWKEAKTDATGQAKIDLHSTHLPMTVFAAAPGHAAALVDEWVPEEQSNLSIEMTELAQGGSMIFNDGTGEIPGLSGRLNPILDNQGRTYLYADNISINDGTPQPVTFRFKEAMRLIDANGVSKQVRIISMMGSSALVEHDHLTP